MTFSFQDGFNISMGISKGSKGKNEIYKIQSVQMGTLFFGGLLADPFFIKSLHCNLITGTVIARTTKEDEANFKSYLHVMQSERHSNITT